MALATSVALGGWAVRALIATGAKVFADLSPRGLAGSHSELRQKRWGGTSSDKSHTEIFQMGKVTPLIIVGRNV